MESVTSDEQLNSSQKNCDSSDHIQSIHKYLSLSSGNNSCGRLVDPLIYETVFLARNCDKKVSKPY